MPSKTDVFFRSALVREVLLLLYLVYVYEDTAV